MPLLPAGRLHLNATVIQFNCAITIMSTISKLPKNPLVTYTLLSRQSIGYMSPTLSPLQDARSHTNLGAILHLIGKYAEAADSYREALRLQPNDVTTLTNLHKLHSVMT